MTDGSFCFCVSGSTGYLDSLLLRRSSLTFPLLPPRREKEHKWYRYEFLKILNDVPTYTTGGLRYGERPPVVGA